MSLAHSYAKGLETEGDTEGVCHQWLLQSQRENLQGHVACFKGLYVLTFVINMNSLRTQNLLVSQRNNIADRSEGSFSVCSNNSMFYELKPRKPHADKQLNITMSEQPWGVTEENPVSISNLYWFPLLWRDEADCRITLTRSTHHWASSEQNIWNKMCYPVLNTFIMFLNSCQIKCKNTFGDSFWTLNPMNRQIRFYSKCPFSLHNLIWRCDNARITSETKTKGALS